MPSLTKTLLRWYLTVFGVMNNRATAPAADVDRFHEGVTVICELLARHCRVPAQELTPVARR